MNASKPVVLKEDLTEERLGVHLGASGDGGCLAVDCEMMGLKPVRDRLCVVQMCDKNHNTTLVQISNDQQEAPNLKKLLESEKVTKVFHFGRADMAFLRFQLGIDVKPLFCTKIASKIARTYTERHGLRDIAKEFVGIDINKNQQSSDWGRGTLTSEQVDYAAGDVIHLLRIKDSLVEMLEREDRIELAERCFAQVPLLVELDLLEYNYVFEHHPPVKN